MFILIQNKKIKRYTKFRRTEYGFSLLETIISLALASLSLGLIFQVYSGGLHVTKHGNLRERAVLVAQNVLMQAGIVSALQPGESDGLDGRYRWRLSVSSTGQRQLPVSPDRGRLLDLTVFVHWSGPRGRPQMLSLRTARFVPNDNRTGR